MAKISVVIPVYNSDRYIRRCLDSVLAQTFMEFELICVDDGSTDGTLQVLKEYEQKDARVYVYEQENRYAGAARNYGLEKATGKYIIFLDSDDFFEPDMLEELYDRAKKTGAQITVCDGKTYNDKTGEFTEVTHYLVKEQLPETLVFHPEDLREYLFQFTVPAPWNKLYLKKFLEKNDLKFQEIKRTNDLYFTYISFVCAKKIAVLDKRLINYRTNVDASLQGSNEEGTYEFIEALEKLKQTLQEKGLWAKYEQSFVNRALSICLFNLNKVTDQDAYMKLYDKLMNEVLNRLNVLSHIQKYYYKSRNYAQLAKLIRQGAKESWRQKNSLPKTTSEILDPKQWIRPIPENDTNLKVSVIIPIYNVEEYIEECVDSVVNQTLKEIEILCINDGTQDRSIEKIRHYIAHDNRVRLINRENGGLSKTRNVGMQEARGEYILFLDSDDYLHRRALEILYYEAKKQNLDQLYYSASMFYDGGVSILRDDYYERSDIYYEARTGRKLFFEMVSHKDFKPSACLVISRREFFSDNQLQFKEGLIHEDNLFTIQAMYFSKRSAYINANLYMRRIRKDSIMTDGQNFRHAYFHYVIIRELKKFAVAKHIDVTSTFFEALTVQMERLQIAAGKYIVEMDPKELQREMQALQEEEILDFYLSIVTAARRREQYKNTLERAKANGQSVAVFRQRAKILSNMVAQKNIKTECLEKKTKQPQKLKRQALDKDSLNTAHPDVSVIIPVYNAEKYLEQCLQSILNQTLKNIEIICVNDGSKDRSGEIIKKFVRQDTRIRLLEQKNGGAAAARNKAIPEAKGDYIIFIDADDYVEEKALEYLYKSSVRERLDMIMYSAKVFYDDYKGVMQKDYYERQGKYNQILTGQEMFGAMVERGDFKASPVLYMTDRHVMMDHQILFVDCLHEDNSFTPQVLFYAKRVKYVNLKFYHRRIHQKSIMTDENYFRHALHYYYVVKDLEQFLVKNHIIKETPIGEAFDCHIRNLIGGAIRYLQKMKTADIEKEKKRLSVEDRIGFERYVLYRMKIEKKIEARDARIKKLNKSLKQHKRSPNSATQILKTVYRKLKK